MEQGGGFNMTSFRGAPLRHCEAGLFRSRWIRSFGRTAFDAAIWTYRYIEEVRLMLPLLLRLVLFLCPFIAARTCLLVGARTTFPYLNGGPLKKKRPARRGLAGHGGDSEAALVRGDRLRVMGMRLTGGGWPFGVASFRGYAIDCQRSISFVV